MKKTFNLDTEHDIIDRIIQGHAGKSLSLVKTKRLRDTPILGGGKFDPAQLYLVMVADKWVEYARLQREINTGDASNYYIHFSNGDTTSMVTDTTNKYPVYFDFGTIIHKAGEVAEVDDDDEEEDED